MRYYLFLSLVLSGSLLACEEPEQVEPQLVKFPGVDPQLRIYFQRFEDEATARGLQVDLTQAGITGEIMEIEDNHVLGRCSFPRAQPNRVTVDQSFWSRGSDLFREFVVFHELGHCFLFRPHLEDRLSNGACSSIMRSGNGPCLDNYSQRTRNFYIDELFDHGSLTSLR
jgi:hypothetical protein